jgi:hypothetical protein
MKLTEINRRFAPQPGQSLKSCEIILMRSYLKCFELGEIVPLVPLVSTATFILKKGLTGKKREVANLDFKTFRFSCQQVRILTFVS